MQNRESALHQWLKSIYPKMDYTLTPLAGDASFRRYYRFHQNELSLIVMDAPPDKINITPFVYVRALLAEQGILTPQIYALDEKLGFALLEDFGDILLRDALQQQNSQPLYQTAIQTLIQMQQLRRSQQPLQLEAFDQAFMLQELSLFHEWFLQRYLGLNLQEKEHQLLDETFQMLTTNIANQPQVLVHRDYHSRNIMILNQDPHTPPKFGIIDFQDAVLGPITYDLVSLLKDCYIHLPREQLLGWLQYYYDQTNLDTRYSFAAFQQAFDWCGLQRHLRILGTFSRLHLRDAKSNYLQDLPRTYQYVTTCMAAYPEFQVFSKWLQQRVDPCFQRTVVV